MSSEVKKTGCGVCGLRRDIIIALSRGRALSAQGRL